MISLVAAPTYRPVVLDTKPPYLTKIIGVVCKGAGGSITVEQQGDVNDPNYVQYVDVQIATGGTFAVLGQRVMTGGGTAGVPAGYPATTATGLLWVERQI